MSGNYVAWSNNVCYIMLCLSAFELVCAQGYWINATATSNTEKSETPLRGLCNCYCNCMSSHEMETLLICAKFQLQNSLLNTK